MSTDHQVPKECKRRRSFGPQEAESGRLGSGTARRDVRKETREHNNQTNRNVENSRQQSPHKYWTSRRRQDVPD